MRAGEEETFCQVLGERSTYNVIISWCIVEFSEARYLRKFGCKCFCFFSPGGQQPTGELIVEDLIKPFLLFFSEWRPGQVGLAVDYQPPLLDD